jgi:hypothetical protein
LNKNSAYLNKDSLDGSIKKIKISKILKKKNNLETMTFEEFNLFLNEYSNKPGYPDINK